MNGNRNVRISREEGGKAKTERKENQVGKKGKGIKNKRQREEKAKKRRDEKGRDNSTDKIAKLRRKGREK